jgi:hypothetical protein
MRFSSPAEMKNRDTVFGKMPNGARRGERSPEAERRRVREKSA